MQKTCWLWIVAIMLLSSCIRNKEDNKLGTPFATCKGEYLSREELLENMPKGLTKEDSLKYVDTYISNWRKDVLLYDIARNNISNSEEIDILVERYRRSLIVYKYQQQLINEKVEPTISQEDIESYYLSHTQNFILNEDIINGLYLKIPIDAPSVKKVREWYSDSSQIALEKIEKYSIQNAVEYQMFYNKWTSFEELIEQIPITIKDYSTFVQQNRKIEVSDSSFYYFLYIHRYKLKGDKAPLEFAQNTIYDILLNQRKMVFMQNFMEELNEIERNEKIKKNKHVE